MQKTTVREEKNRENLHKRLINLINFAGNRAKMLGYRKNQFSKAFIARSIKIKPQNIHRIENDLWTPSLSKLIDMEKDIIKLEKEIYGTSNR